MKLAISNLAYNSIDELDDSISNVEVVFNKIGGYELSTKELLQYKDNLAKFGKTPISAQSLYYNSNVESITSKEFLTHMYKIIDYSKVLQLSILVFGSPKLRHSISMKELGEIFKKIDTKLDGTGITLVIEPNAIVYGGTFFHTVSSIVEFLDANKFSNIATMIDTHNLLLECNEPAFELTKYFDYISHVHVSEKHLGCFKLNNSHLTFADKLRELNYSGIITYETTELKNVSHFKQFYK